MGISVYGSIRVSQSRRVKPRDELAKLGKEYADSFFEKEFQALSTGKSTKKSEAQIAKNERKIENLAVKAARLAVENQRHAARLRTLNARKAGLKSHEKRIPQNLYDAIRETRKSYQYSQYLPVKKEVGEKRRIEIRTEWIQETPDFQKAIGYIERKLSRGFVPKDKLLGEAWTIKIAGSTFDEFKKNFLKILTRGVWEDYEVKERTP